MKFIVYEDLLDGSINCVATHPIARFGNGAPIVPPKSRVRFIGKFEARKRNEAGQKFYDIMGWGKHKPMLDIMMAILIPIR